MTERKIPRIAAVLVLVYPRLGQPHVVFTERTHTVPNHRGHVSLPGGSREPTDPTLEFTALRETEEELGVPGHQVRILGMLGEVDTLGGSFRITPYVGLLHHEPLFCVQPGEVATVIEVPLSHLRDPRVIGEVEREVQGMVRKVRSYEFGRHRIWGPTGLVVEEFLATDYPEIATRALGQQDRLDLLDRR